MHCYSLNVFNWGLGVHLLTYVSILDIHSLILAMYLLQNYVYQLYRHFTMKSAVSQSGRLEVPVDFSGLERRIGMEHSVMICCSIQIFVMHCCQSMHLTEGWEFTY